ncbi:hypothetical protein ACIGCM_05505 [Pseudomonas sp. NPDC078700]|uniref:hypothetical protein n=1 Tax=Pseudomonas sp. NPDC078700 TaxID=3364424 RepID=UPI0037CC770F
MLIKSSYNSAVKLLILFFGINILTGCALISTEDKYSSSYIDAHIIEGKTTQRQIQDIYGVPDDNEKSSNGTTWVYNRGEYLGVISKAISYVPGTGSIQQAIGLKQDASTASDTARKVSGKYTGDTEVHGSWLYITFNKNGVVNYWSIE